MSHYCKVVDGKVTQVIVAEADFFNNFVDTSPGQWLQTSYNTDNQMAALLFVATTLVLVILTTISMTFSLHQNHSQAGS